MTTYFSDLFSTGANTPLTSHTSDSGHTWTLVKGATSPQVFTASGGIVANGANLSTAVITRPSVIAPTADTTVLATYHYDSVNFSYVGVTARMSADGSSGYLAAYSITAKKWGIWRLSSAATATSSAELVGQSGTSVYASGDEPVVEFSVTGTGAEVTLKLTVSGTEIINYVDTDALRVVEVGYTGVYFFVALAAGSGMWITRLDAIDSAAITVPGAPVIGTAVAGDGTISVAFTAPGSDGGSAITGYTATLSTGQTNTGASSPIVVSATNGTPTTATVYATNAIGNSAESSASNSVTPAASGATVSSVTVSPSTATVTGLASQTFTATVIGTGSPSQSVTWTSTYGGITSGGVFTAPVSIGSDQTITVTATSVLDNTKAGTATVTVPAVAVVGSPLSKLQYQDVVSDTSTSASATSLTLAGLPPSGRRSFASVYPVGTNNIPVMIREQSGSNWMLCSCTLSAATTLQVDSIFSSSNAGSAPTFTTSIKDVFVTVPAVRVVRKDFIDLADYPVDPTFTTDSTAGIQQAILDAYSSGIGKIRVPTGRYKIAGPRVSSGNCQLYIPQTREAAPNKSIYFEGVSPPNFEQQGLRNVTPPTNGCVFESTLIGVGVGGTNPSVIGCEQGNSGDAWVWNYTNVGIKNLCVRTAVANSDAANSMSALNFQFCAQVAELDMLRIDVNRGLQDMIEPNTGSCGIIMPPINNHLLLNVGMVYISGYNNAVIFQEHTHFRSLISIGNVNGIVLKNSNHGSWVGMYSAEWNKNAIVIDGNHDLSIGLYDAEHNGGANFSFVRDILYNSGSRKVSIQHSLVVISGSGINDGAFSTNATSANYKIIVGSGAN